jgi:F-type H+-transporting ATPase subunit c
MDRPQRKKCRHLTRTMLVGMAVAQSTAIYAMVISLVLIFVV